MFWIYMKNNSTHFTNTAGKNEILELISILLEMYIIIISKKCKRINYLLILSSCGENVIVIISR